MGWIGLHWIGLDAPCSALDDCASKKNNESGTAASEFCLTFCCDFLRRLFGIAVESELSAVPVSEEIHTAVLYDVLPRSWKAPFIVQVNCIIPVCGLPGRVRRRPSIALACVCTLQHVALRRLVRPTLTSFWVCFHITAAGAASNML